MTDVYIVDAVRTPIGRVHGALAGISLEDLLAPLILALLSRNAIEAATVNEIIVGNAAGPGGNPARVALLSAGLPVTVPGLTIDRQCGSGLEAINLAARLIQSGAASVVIAGGAESPSTAPRRARPGGSDDAPVFYSRARFAPDSVGDPEMGIAAENVASACAISRTRQDEYAFHSHRKAIAAQASGRFTREIVAITTTHGIVRQDECPRSDCTVEALSALLPVFRLGGTVTAGNACPVNDGAALVLLLSGELRAELQSRSMQCRSLKFIDSNAVGVDPNLLGMGPVPAVRALLEKHQLTTDSLAQVEFNEAFAAQVLASADQLRLDPATLNPAGGALALGHPYGASGAILVTRLLHDLMPGQTGLATLGIGGGIGLATLFMSAADF